MAANSRCESDAIVSLTYNYTIVCKISQSGGVLNMVRIQLKYNLISHAQYKPLTNDYRYDYVTDLAVGGVAYVCYREHIDTIMFDWSLYFM